MWLLLCYLTSTTGIHLPSEKEGLKGIGCSMAMALDTKKTFRVNSGYGFIFRLLWHFITKRDRYYYKTWQLFHWKMRQKFIPKCVSFFYHKMRQFHYKIRFLLRNASAQRRNIVFFIWVFFHKHSRFAGQQGKDEAISLTPLYHFHLLHRHLDITGVITAESSSLHVAGSRTWTEKPDTLIHGHGCIDYIECNFTDSFDTFNTEKDSADTDNESDNEEVLSKNKQTKN